MGLCVSYLSWFGLGWVEFVFCWGGGFDDVAVVTAVVVKVVIVVVILTHFKESLTKLHAFQ